MDPPSSTQRNSRRSLERVRFCLSAARTLSPKGHTAIRPFRAPVPQSLCRQFQKRDYNWNCDTVWSPGRRGWFTPPILAIRRPIYEWKYGGKSLQASTLYLSRPGPGLQSALPGQTPGGEKRLLLILPNSELGSLEGGGGGTASEEKTLGGQSDETRHHLTESSSIIFQIGNKDAFLRSPAARCSCLCPRYHYTLLPRLLLKRQHRWRLWL